MAFLFVYSIHKVMSFDEIAKQAFTAINGIAGKTVSYHRGDLAVNAKATIGKTMWKVEGNDNSLVSFQSTDFIFKSIDLSAMGEPKQGDLIQFGTSIYEVNRPDGSQQHFRYSDSGRKIIRVFTVHVGTGDAGSFSSQFNDSYDTGE